MDDPFATCKVPTTTFDRAMLDRILSKPRSKVMYISNDAAQAILKITQPNRPSMSTKGISRTLMMRAPLTPRATPAARRT